MLTTYLVYIGIVLFGIGLLAFLFRLTNFLLIIFVGKHYQITYTDYKGIKPIKTVALRDK